MNILSFFRPFQLILTRLNHMSSVLDNLDQSVANLTTVVGSAAKLLNDLNAKIQAGAALDPAKVQADVDAINAQISALQTAVTNDTPAT